MMIRYSGLLFWTALYSWKRLSLVFGPSAQVTQSSAVIVAPPSQIVAPRRAAADFVFFVAHPPSVFPVAATVGSCELLAQSMAGRGDKPDSARSRQVVRGFWREVVRKVRETLFDDKISPRVSKKGYTSSIASQFCRLTSTPH